MVIFIKNKYKLRGFTMIELSISVAIIMLMSTVILIDYPDSVIKLNLANLNHRIALLLREAQIRGSSVDSRNSTVAGYGVYFELSNKKIVTVFNDFADSSIPVTNGIYIGNGLYSTTTLDETSSVVSLRSRYTFSKLCVGNGYPFSCNNDENAVEYPINSLTISFKRPNPKALVYINNTTISNLGGACLEIISPKYPVYGHVRSVRIFSSGMITTSNDACQ